MSEQQKQFQLTLPITQSYIQKIAPLQILVQAIALQNKEIYQLEKKYIEMSELVANIQHFEPNPDAISNRQKQQILQRKYLMEQALVANEAKYKSEFQKQKSSKLEEISLVKQIKEMNSGKNGNKINIFMNLSEGILGQLLEENKNSDQATACIKNWKDDYERQKRKLL